MVLKVVDATELRVGSNVIIEGEPYTIRSTETSKTGKHGHAKCRMEAISMISGKKKVLVIPGHERFEIPMIEKRKAQVLSISGKIANIMDAESFESFDLAIPEELEGQVQESMTIEYWDIEGLKIMKRIF